MNHQHFLKKSLIIGLLGLSFVSLGLRIYLDGYFYQNSPREPITIEGKIYPRNVHHGAHVYLTKNENLALDHLPSAFIILFVAGAFLNERWKWLGLYKKQNG
jgi:hypothetical protein